MLTFPYRTMSKTEKLAEQIKTCKAHNDLKTLWDSREDVNGKVKWPKGKLMEYLVVRSFELESSDSRPVHVTYPYSVRESFLNNEELEQIDGAVHVQNLHALIECKDYHESKIDIEPLVKLRFRLQVRHSAAFGIFFSCTELSQPAEYWIQMMAPQLIVFWDKEDLEYCLENRCFVDCLEMKYRMAIDKREYNYHYCQTQKKPEECLALV